jgi:hypothetical protein
MQPPVTGESAEEAAAKAAEAKRAREEEASFFLRREGEQPQAYAERIFTRVFQTDIERLVSMEVGGSSQGVYHPSVHTEAVVNVVPMGHLSQGFDGINEVAQQHATRL